MFEQNITLKDIITEYLKDSQESISSLHRKLNKKGYDFHRLILTGYLKALADMGQIQENEIKPAKVYSIKTQSKKNIYEILGEEIKEITDSQKEQIQLGIYLMQKLFHRPIFLEELKKCKLEMKKIDAKKIGGEKRAQARKIFSNTLIKLPFNDPSYLIDNSYIDIERFEKLRQEIMQNIIATTFNLATLTVKNMQIKLNE